MSAPATTGTTAYRPVLFLGLGGTGKEVLLRLRARMFERFRTYKAPFVRFLWIDTDTRATDARGAELSSALSNVGFEETEKFALLNGSVGKDLTDIFQNPLHWPHIHSWLYPGVQTFGSEIADGAGGVRAVGRLTFFAKYADMRDLIERRLRELASVGTIGQTQQFFKEHKLPPVGTSGEGDAAPVVFVVTSLAGGTGCGTYLDTGFLLRDIKRLNPRDIADISAYAVLPNVYNPSPQGEIAQRSYANAYAALKELDHFTKRMASAQSLDAREGNPHSDFLVSWEPGHPLKIPGPPYSATYLIESTNQANLTVGPEHRGDLFAMLAETMFLDLLPGPFSDAKRSNYSNIVQALSGPAGANTPSAAGSINFTQAFARRYASCGMSKIEIPLDAVRGACASRLANDIFAYIAREREDADAGRAVPRDLAGARLDRAGIYDSFGSGWKNIVMEAVAGAMQGLPVRSAQEAHALRAALDKVEHDTVLVDTDRVGTAIGWVRGRTAGVNAEARERLYDLLRDRVLENPERGLVTALRQHGYFDLLLARTRELLDPTQAGKLSVWDAARAEAEQDAQANRAVRDQAWNELDVALRSVPAQLLGAREQVVKIMLARVRDAQEQYLKAVVDHALLLEARNVTLELLQQTRAIRDALAAFLQKADAMRGMAQRRHETFQTGLTSRPHTLFLQLYDPQQDWPRFYKLDRDTITQQPGEVDPRREYVSLLREFGVRNGLAGLAELVSRTTTDEINRRVEEFCDRRFYEDFIAHPREAGILDHPLLRESATFRQTIQNFVNHARPMLRRDEKVAASVVQSTTFAYLGLAEVNSPAALEFTKEIRGLMPPGCTFDTIDTGRRNEIYLYFSTFAFPLPAVTLVQNECHRAYTDFYSHFHPGEARAAVNGIPLHLSKRWEGRFDDLVIYSDRDAELLEQVIDILNLAPPLRILTLKTGADEMPEYCYKEAPPFTAQQRLGNRRGVTSMLMANADLRDLLTAEVQRREAALTPAQLQAYFWALQAQYENPQLDRETPESQLLRKKVTQVYARAQAMHASDPASPPALDLDASGGGDRLSWIKSQELGLIWEAGQPVVQGLDLWRR